MAKEDFLPIPDAPDYEVNGYYVVRDCKTKRVCKPTKCKMLYKTYYCVSVRVRGKNNTYTNRTGEYCYQLALAAIDSTIWTPVPSLKGRYELTETGELRNARTKKILKLHQPYRYYYVHLSKSNKNYAVTLDQLLFEVYGVEPVKPELPPKLEISKGDEKLTFTTFKACAEFLSPREFYTAKTIAHRLEKRPAELYGWAIKYF